MKSQRFTSICQAVQNGQERHVEHQVTHQTGKIVACSGINFEVETDGRHQNWAMQNCEEQT
ncbi:hypothetical protein DESUT3_33360 [Desulfuromonas versatilis]|uniref:Uncharacterized protein n=1 Tax=Desulfuromonas versatilis TaxID=2802975 RepID=A0ABN6E1P5_9BACT|nr:hypothetical protein [Desulfuromonas versatilis]BCR06267.1 hypothetical protein DESUT3_33360 [Desulfuromonas versatilis]